MKPFFLLISIYCCVLISCKTEKENSSSLIKEYKKDVTYLASDSLEGREVGTEGEIKAANYIAERMKKIGLLPKGNKNSYFQNFTRKTKAHPHDTIGTGKELTARNVLGFIDNGAATTLVIGAHYDHLGYGEEGSLADSAGQIHNGADDNASGVAALLGLANKFKNKPLTSNVLFIAFTGEEKGLWGSNYFVKNATIPTSEIKYMINMDMVGRLDSANRLAIYGIGTSPVFKPILDSCNIFGFKTKFDSSGIGPSDHTSFYLENIPVLHFFTGQHKDYHKPTDDAEFINYEGIEKVANYIEKIIVKLNEYDSIPFIKTREKSNKARAFNVTLGVIPDYLFDGKGMKIDGVKQKRPAENAGLLKGDVIIKMDSYPITSMSDYMKCLSVFKKGSTISILILRNGEEVEKVLTFNE